MGEIARQGRVLRSWKDVASYLRCSVRTCVRWEERYGLPVHRIGKTSKSGIFAYEVELEAWLRKRSEGDQFREVSRHRQLRRAKAFYLIPIILVAGIAFLAGFILLSSYKKAQPIDFRIDKTMLIVIDDGGRELWSHDTKLESLVSDSVYRNHFQTKRPGDPGPLLPYLIIKDINADGWNEILFSTHTQLEIGEGELYCFDHLGNRLWRYKSGREMTYGNQAYSGDYRIKGIDCVDLNGDGRLEIVVIAVQRPEWPCQLSVLDCMGKRIGEYWNGGYIGDYAFDDSDTDGRIDVIIAGVYNERKTGFLAVFDSANISGGSPQLEEEFICKQLSPGSQKYYIIVPRTDVDSVRFLNESIDEIQILNNGRISVKTGYTRIYYEFGPNLKVLDIKDSHTFQLMHKELALQGLVASKLDREYYEQLKEKVLYWNGKDWTNKPTTHNSR